MSKGFALMLILVFLTASQIMAATPVSGASMVGNSWTEMAPMEQARGGLGVVAVGDAIFAIGGSTSDALYPSSADSGGFVGTNEEYNITTGVWTYKAPMPIPRDYFAIAAYQNKIYCIGGQTGWEQDQAADYLWEPVMSPINEVYDIATNTWENMAPMPTGGMNLQATAVDGQIFVGGYVYNITADSWSNTTTLPFWSWYQTPGGPIDFIEINVNNKMLITDVQDGAAVETSGMNAPIRAYVIGPTVNEVYNPEANSWTKGATMLTPRVDFGLTIENDLIYAIGGFTQGPSGVNEKYTPIGYGTPDPTYLLEHVPPAISIISPINQIYTNSTVPLIFSLGKTVTWTKYSLDGQQNVTVTGNTTIPKVTNGLHNLTVYANDTYGNIGASETITFTVAKTSPFPTLTVAAVAGTVTTVTVAAGLLLYFKHKRLLKR